MPGNNERARKVQIRDLAPDARTQRTLRGGLLTWSWSDVKFTNVVDKVGGRETGF